MQEQAPNYTVLHLHSMLSNGTTNIDSVTKFEEYVDYAKKLNMKSIAFTEHGNTFNWLKKKEYCEKNGLKYIHGIELYLTETLKEKKRDNYHVCLYAKNQHGVSELNKLISAATNRQDGHFYFVPRITFDELYETSNNIIVTTACLGNVFKSNDENLINSYVEFLTKNKERCFLELQHHNVSRQKELNKKLLLLSYSNQIPFIITTDTHALNDVHLEGRSILQKAKNINFEDEKGWDLTFKTYDELFQLMVEQNVLTEEEIRIGLSNTNVLANLIETFDVDRTKKYPKLFNDPLNVLKQKINQGVINRGINKLPNYKSDYLPRIYEELETYIYNDAVDFLLLDTTIKEYARENGVECGYSRGSVSGSVIAYLLGMTDMDSVKYNLNFQRFMNKERVSLADVDTDWQPNQRDFVKDYIYGLENVYCCDIVTFNTIAIKGAVRDVCRALGYSVDIANKINSEIEYNEQGVREQYPDVFKYADIVTGTVVSIGSHPCGTVVSPVPLDQTIGIYTLATNDKPVSMINMKEIDSLNFVKLDILGLDNIEIINETCRLANIDRLTPDHMDDKDEDVWLDIRDNTTFIFQWESDSAQSYLRMLFSDKTISKIKENNSNFSYIDLFSVGNGAIRPAGASYRNELANGVFRDNGHKALNDFLAPTLGYCVEENQLISTIDGKKPIKDICEGDIVYTENGINPVFKKVYMGKKETVNITTSVNNIKCTNDHKILTDSGWKKAEEINIGDCVAYRVGTESNNDYSRNKLGLLAYIIGDGMITRGNTVGFINANLDVAINFKNMVELEFDNLTASITERSSRVNNVPLYLCNVKYAKHSKKTNELALYLKDVGLKSSSGDGCNARNKFIPEFIFSLNEECLLSFIGAFIDTDSCIKNNNKKILSFKSSSYEVATGLKEIGRLLGYKFYINHDKNTESYSINATNVCSLLRKLYNYSIKIRKTYTLEDLENTRAGNHSSIKRSVVVDILRKNKISLKKVVRELGVNLYSKSKYISIDNVNKINEVYKVFPDYLLNKKVVWVNVTDKYNNGLANVYDIEVENEHNFTCQDIIVHNCVYQEQIIEFLNKFCGFTMGEADTVRRGFAKKTGTDQYIPRIKKGFIETMSNEYNTSREKAEEIVENFLTVIQDASDYLFSVNHALSYSYIGYACGYLRYYYPLEFITCSLNNVMNKSTDNSNEKTENIIKYGISRGIKFEDVKFGYSTANYTFNKETNTIYKGIKPIKYMNEQIADELLIISKNYHETLIDLFVDIEENTTLNSRQMKILIMLGFFEDVANDRYMLEVYELFQKRYNKKHSEKTKVARLEELKSLLLPKESQGAFSISERVKFQLEYLGYITYKNDRINKRVGVIIDVSEKYSTRHTNIYLLNGGKTHQFKIKHSILQETGITVGDCVFIKEFEQKFKKIQENGKWISTNEKYFQITNIKKLSI